MHILVTGGAGFIGSEVVRQLVRETRHHVINLDALTYAGNLDSLAEVCDEPRYHWEWADVTNRAVLDTIFRENRPGAVIHLAAESHVDRSIDGPGAFLRTNVQGTYELLEAATAYWRTLPLTGRAAFRFVHVSTDEVFGSLGPNGLFDERTPYHPSSPYSATKAASDHLVRAWHHTYGLPTIVTNCSNNYGPFQYPEKLIPLMILNALEGKPLPVYGRGENVRDWLHVADHARALRTVLERGIPGETYCVGARCERTNLEVVTTLCAILDELAPLGEGRSHAGRIAHVADRPGHDHRYAIDPTKLERELGWRPRFNFEEGLRQTVRWYLDRADWWRPIREGRYRGERLGAGHPVAAPAAAG